MNIIAAFICYEQEGKKIKRLKARHEKGSNGQVSFNDVKNIEKNWKSVFNCTEGLGGKWVGNAWQTG